MQAVMIKTGEHYDIHGRVILVQERLKEAMEHDRTGGRPKLEAERQGWAEYIFGICRPDGRMGKHGSRSAAQRQTLKKRSLNKGYWATGFLRERQEHISIWPFREKLLEASVL